MGLKEVLSKLKLVEVSEPAEAERAASQQRSAGRSSGTAHADSPELEELLRSLPPPKPIDESLLAKRRRADAPAQTGGAASAAQRSGGAASGAERSDGAPAGADTDDNDLELPDFPAVYRAAGITEPAHGFSAFKVLEMLQSPGLAELPPQAKASALAGFLKMNPGGPVAIGEVIQDAVRRDQALDRFEQFLQTKVAERQAAAERANALLQAEIDSLTERHRASMAANVRAVTDLTARLSEWSAGKRVEERRLQSAVAPFVDGNPISTESADGAKPGS
ncbi:MAG: hypothetical protein ABIV06_07555 [Thermoanaerobaculia bacterium]